MSVECGILSFQYKSIKEKTLFQKDNIEKKHAAWNMKKIYIWSVLMYFIYVYVFLNNDESNDEQ